MWVTEVRPPHCSEWASVSAGKGQHFGILIVANLTIRLFEVAPIWKCAFLLLLQQWLWRLFMLIFFLEHSFYQFRIYCSVLWSSIFGQCIKRFLTLFWHTGRQAFKLRSEVSSLDLVVAKSSGKNKKSEIIVEMKNFHGFNSKSIRIRCD